VPVLGFAAFSGTGKTTLLVKVLNLLKQRGHRVGTVKHAHHSFDTDAPGKDSYEMRRAGAVQVVIGSRQRWALVTETENAKEPSLDELLGHLDQDRLDLVLVEGFKSETFPKIELHRPSLRHPLMCSTDKSIVAVASDAPLNVKLDVPVLDLNSPDEIVAFVLEFVSRSSKRAKTAVEDPSHHQVAEGGKSYD
jgi:molybdopterin-guanine dinucleotide biosynthesis protein B